MAGRRIVRGTGPTTPRVAVLWLIVLAGLAPAAVAAGDIDISGYLEGELRWYPSSPLFEGQSSEFASVAAQFETWWASSDDTHALEGKLFYRHTTAEDGERTHGDIRELYYRYLGQGWQLEAGVNKTFWGVIESAHLVDIVNQTDNVEAVNGEEKLGQPLVLLGIEQHWGNLDLFVMPWFRERVFASGDERFQFGNPVTATLIPFDATATRWESSREGRHIDAAARWSQYFGSFDIALSWFRGTHREPIPIASDGFGVPGTDFFVTTELAAYYEIMQQFGVELQYLHGDWAFKLEGTHRHLGSGDYNAMGSGFEYTFSNLEPWGQDVGAIVEYLWNDRRDVDTRPFVDPNRVAATPDSSTFTIPGDFLSPFEDDLFAGARFAFNDVNSTEFVGGFIYDLSSGTTVGSFEGSTRIGNSVRVALNAYLYSNVANDSSFFFYRHDDLLELKIDWFF